MQQRQLRTCVDQRSKILLFIAGCWLPYALAGVQVVKALALFKSEDKNKSFPFLHSRNLLRSHQKWIERSSRISSQKLSWINRSSSSHVVALSQKKQKTTPNSSPSSSNPSCDLDDSLEVAAQCEVLI